MTTYLYLDVHSVDISFILFPNTFEYTIIKIGKRELSEKGKITGVYAPIAEITLKGFARSTANIPEDATNFCWLYPPYNIINEEDLSLNDLYESSLLKLGGFAYFIADRDNGGTLRPVRVNSLIVPATNGLVFESPDSWRKEFTEQLWSQKRFQVSFLFFRIPIFDYLAGDFIISS